MLFWTKLSLLALTCYVLKHHFIQREHSYKYHTIDVCTIAIISSIYHLENSGYNIYLLAINS